MCYENQSDSKIVAATRIDEITIRRDHTTNKVTYSAIFRLVDSEDATIDGLMLRTADGDFPTVSKKDEKSIRDIVSGLHLLMDKDLVEKKIFKNGEFDLSAIKKKIKRAKK